MNEDGEKPEHITGDIEFNDVNFTFPARQEKPVMFTY